MEYEVRFYYPTEEKDKILQKLRRIENLNNSKRTYEKTIQYNHSDPRYNFYSKNIDGRLRLRISLNGINDNCKISWKRRLPDTLATTVNKEEEKEVHLAIDDLENMLYILENVLHFKVVECYERYRTIFFNDDVEISLDEYPFGIAIEIENKSLKENPEYIVKKWTEKLNLKISDAYRLSWDDKYSELCNEQNIERYDEVTFDKIMPKVK